MSKITDLTELTSGNIHDDDLVEIVDVSDTSMAATGTNKKAKLSTLRDAGLVNWKLLSTTTISGNPSTVEIPLSGSYRGYMFQLENVYCSSSGSAMRMRTSTNGGSTFDSSSGNYGYAYNALGTYGPVLNTGTYIEMFPPSGLSNSSDGVFGHVTFFDPLNSALKAFAEWKLFGRRWNNANPDIYVGTGYRDTAADVDTVQFLWSAGNFGGGKVRLFGWSE